VKNCPEKDFHANIFKIKTIYFLVLNRKPRPHRALGGQRPYRGNSRSSDGVKDGGGRYDSLSAPGPPYDDQVVIQHFLEKEKGKNYHN